MDGTNAAGCRAVSPCGRAADGLIPRKPSPAPARGAAPLQVAPTGARGLYDSRNEHDACGVGFVADIQGRKSRHIIADGLKILENLEHRGAVGADACAGDGAGILIQLPDLFFREECAALGIALPAAGDYAIGHFFLPRDAEARAAIRALTERIVDEEGQTVLGWREVPVDNSDLSYSVRPTEPAHLQLIVGRGRGVENQDHFERKLFVIRKRIFNTLFAQTGRMPAEFYIPSLSSRTLIYKGMLRAGQVGTYYRDLADPRVVSALALVHQRFSTNTFPTWRLAHPFRMISHNGEINTLRGNVNWIQARYASMRSEILGDDMARLWPIAVEGQSDSACFDNALELLVMGGYPLAHAMMMLIPEAWAGDPLMDPERRAFYEYHAALMEPWDGPAAIAFTDGRQIGATLDRNGLRPARYLVTDDGLVVMASEAGVLDLPEERIVQKWRLQPGRMLLVDLEQGRIVTDEELKADVAGKNPYRRWVEHTRIVLEDMAPVAPAVPPAPRPAATLLDLQQAFGYSQEDLKFLLAPMALDGQEAVGSMGNDTPVSVLSARPRLLYTYFKQNFAQVTNPPIDPIREALVMSLVSFIGPRPNLFDLGGLSSVKRLEVRQPVLTNGDLEKIRAIGAVPDNHFRAETLDITFPAEGDRPAMADHLGALCARAEAAVAEGFNIIILSDRAVSAGRMPIPALLATSAVHHHLIGRGLRTSVGLVVETGEAREVHHFACLAGYGAEAINPWLAFESLAALLPDLPRRMTASEAEAHFIKAIDKGLLKVMSRMGISTFQSYCGAQIFDAIGLDADFVERHFAGTASAIGGIGLDEIAAESFQRHRLAFGDVMALREALDEGGEYAFRIGAEEHAWTPDTVRDLQHAVRGNSRDRYRAFSRRIDDQSARLLTLRGLFRLRGAEEDGRAPVPLDEVEPAAAIVRRFATGAMSFGSISREAHTTLAIAMNRIGGRSNTGEGGEQADRFRPLPNGDSMRSSIKQVASGRFGVTTEYLVNADMMQIKMAQGAKPGEGGQLPGHKVDATIAAVRHSTPGVGLISPPPHHDIYSIEDLAQLVFDLKNVNPEGLVSVKLVSEVGVGTVAAGVAKARADHVTVSGFEGGTGAAPLTSIRHAGSPWEIGLAETHQTLVLNRLRGRIRVQVDGGIRTGRDVVIGALLGADEFGFATAPLIAAGCVMMRKCHLNTCPTGIATQDPVLRARFTGMPEHVINYFFFVAEEVREYMAALGYRDFDEMVGQVHMLDRREAVDHWKARGLDFSRLLHAPEVADAAIRHCETQDHGIAGVLDRRLIAQARDALAGGAPVRIEARIRNTDRAVGAMLSGQIARRHGHRGLPADAIHVKLSGTAGQSFGAWAARGLTLELEGEANDYVGKGLSGGRLIVYPAASARIVPEHSIIVGNTVLYGAIAGEAFLCGVAGERFAVRNSGATAVVEGCGDHGCEYMTGGVVAVLGRTGRNFAAGMSGGIAYVLDVDGGFEQRCNHDMIAIEPVLPETPGGADPDDPMHHDEERLRRLIGDHARLTGSRLAAVLLADWAAILPKFRKVVPLEYRHALEEAARAREAATPAAAMAGE